MTYRNRLGVVIKIISRIEQDILELEGEIKDEWRGSDVSNRRLSHSGYMKVSRFATEVWLSECKANILKLKHELGLRKNELFNIMSMDWEQLNQLQEVINNE